MGEKGKEKLLFIYTLKESEDFSRFVGYMCVLCNPAPGLCGTPRGRRRKPDPANQAPWAWVGCTDDRVSRLRFFRRFGREKQEIVDFLSCFAASFTHHSCRITQFGAFRTGSETLSGNLVRDLKFLSLLIHRNHRKYHCKLN